MPSPSRGEGTFMSTVLAAPSVLRFSGWRRRVEVDKNLAVAHLGLEGLERDEAGRLYRLAARHVEGAEVEIALDHVAVERAIGEVGHAVGAARLGGIIGAVDVV